MCAKGSSTVTATGRCFEYRVFVIVAVADKLMRLVSCCSAAAVTSAGLGPVWERAPYTHNSQSSPQTVGNVLECLTMAPINHPTFGLIGQFPNKVNHVHDASDM